MEKKNKSRWRGGETFATFMKRFISHSQPYTENLTFLLQDNNPSSITCENLDICKNN
jgi:hypothetical protein